jgi:hypothetical protein
MKGGTDQLKHWLVVFIMIPILSGCSDSGSEPWTGWQEFDLPYAQIYLPGELVQQTSASGLPENPTFAGVCQGHYIIVEFCIYTFPSGPSFLDYEEEVVMLQGYPAVLFRGWGLLHAYDSSFRPLMGVKAPFKPGGEEVMVLAGMDDAAAYDLVRKILLSLHPQPANTGNPL